MLLHCLWHWNIAHKHPGLIINSRPQLFKGSCCRKLPSILLKAATVIFSQLWIMSFLHLSFSNRFLSQNKILHLAQSVTLNCRLWPLPGLSLLLLLHWPTFQSFTQQLCPQLRVCIGWSLSFFLLQMTEWLTSALHSGLCSNVPSSESPSLKY